MFVALLVLLPIALSVFAAASRHRVSYARVCSEPRELVRRALVVIPSHSDVQALRRAVELILRSDPRVDVAVVEAMSDRMTCAELTGPRVIMLRQPTSVPTDVLRVGAARGLAQQYDAVVELSVEHAGLTQRITGLLQALEDGAHVAIGSRYVSGGCMLDGSVARQLASRGANSVLHWCTRLPLHDVTAHIRAYRRTALERAVLHARGHGRSFALDVLLRCHNAGLRLAEVPVTSAAVACAPISLAESRDLLARAIGWRRPDAQHVEESMLVSALGYESTTRVV